LLPRKFTKYDISMLNGLVGLDLNPSGSAYRVAHANIISLPYGIVRILNERLYKVKVVSHSKHLPPKIDRLSGYISDLEIHNYFGRPIV